VLRLLIWIAVSTPPNGKEGDMSAILVIFTQALIPVSAELARKYDVPDH
jgi:hypothetical protein